jgi:hypothetical protein
MNIGLLLTIVAAAFAIIAAFSQRFIKREKSFDTNASLSPEHSARILIPLNVIYWQVIKSMPSKLTVSIRELV